MNESIELTCMTSKHVSAVINLWEATEGLILTDADRPRELQSYFARNPEFSQVALCNGEVVGAVLCGHDGRRGYLHHLAVSRNYRNRGIGRSLVDRCLSQLQREGIRQCNLFVIDDHQAGKEFWLSGGWFEWPDIRLMSKKLPAL